MRTFGAALWAAPFISLSLSAIIQKPERGTPAGCPFLVDLEGWMKKE